MHEDSQACYHSVKLTHISLFSGIGGIDLACEWAGFETILQCEIDLYCRWVLMRNFPGVTLAGDIKDLDGTQWRGATLLTGGYPCQPVSLAGSRRGESDDRYLWPEMRRVIEEARPCWVVGENVAGHVTMGLERVCADLEYEGYEVQPIIIPAACVGAYHQRYRVFIIAHVCDTNFVPLSARRTDNGNAPEKNGKEGGNRSPSLFDAIASASTDLSDPPTQGRKGRIGGSLRAEETEESERLRVVGRTKVSVSDSHATRWIEGRGTEQARGTLPYLDGRDGWSAEPRVGGGTHGVSSWLDGSWERGIPRVFRREKGRRLRLAALGNAVVPQQIFPIVNLIAQWEREHASGFVTNGA